LASLTFSFSFFSILFLPNILSTTKGKELLLNYHNKQIIGHVDIKNLSLGWFEQKMDEFILKDEFGKQILTIENGWTKTFLPYLILKPQKN